MNELQPFYAQDLVGAPFRVRCQISFWQKINNFGYPVKKISQLNSMVKHHPFAEATEYKQNLFWPPVSKFLIFISKAYLATDL